MNDYEKRQAELKAANQDILNGFGSYLLAFGTARKAAARHLDRISFFADVYLTDYRDLPLAEGVDEISDYLGDWFIRKAGWSDLGPMEENIATFRKFSAYLRDSGRIDGKRFAELEKTIASGSPLWIRHHERYNNPAIELEDVWDFGGGLDDLLAKAEAALAGSPPGPAGVPHFTLMCSALVARHFGMKTQRLPKMDDLAAAGHWASCWRCDLAGSDRASDTFYFIFTNARTLYSLIVPNCDGSLDTLVGFFSEILHHQFQLAGCNVTPPVPPAFTVVRGQPHSLIGSQNDLRRMALHLFEDPDPTLDGLCMKLNETPMSALPETFPDRAFLQHLAADPPLLKAEATSPNIIPFPPPDRN